MALIKWKNKKDTAVVSKAGVEKHGLKPEITEKIQDHIKEAAETGKPVQPLHDTERDIVKRDSGSRKGFFYAVFYDPENKFYKGFAKRRVVDILTGKKYTIDIETPAFEDFNLIGKDLQNRIDAAYHAYGLTGLQL